MSMGLRERFLDALIDGQIGHGIVVTRQEFMQHFSNVGNNYTGVFLSNSEITTAPPHSPTYRYFTIRIRKGVYLIHSQIILKRMQKRGLT